MRRREFSRLVGAGILAGVLPVDIFASTDTTTLDPTSFLAYNANGKLVIHTEGLMLNGVAVPPFGWVWIAMQLAAGALQMLGGKMMGGLVGSVNAGTGKSIEELLQEQLDAMVRAVQDIVTENEVRRYTADMKACFGLSTEYSRTPSNRGLMTLLHDSKYGVEGLASLGFAGYRTYLSAASLRLLLLEDGRQRGLTKLADFEDQVHESTDHHKAIIADIEHQTDPTTYYPAGSPGPTDCWDNRHDGFNCALPYRQVQPAQVWYFRSIPFDRKICGFEMKGLLPITSDTLVALPAVLITQDKQLVAQDFRYLADRMTDFAWLQTKLKNENTDPGAKVVECWNGALAKMKQQG